MHQGQLQRLQQQLYVRKVVNLRRRRKEGLEMKKSVMGVVAITAVGLLVIYGFRGQSEASGDWLDRIAWADPSISREEVAASGKPVFLFVHTEWCTYCKKMKNETFTDPRVQEFLNEMFIPLAINPELPGTTNFTGEELTFADMAARLKVSGYPATFFFSSDGKLIGGQPGYLDARLLADLAEYVGDGHYKQYTFSKFQSLPADQRR